MCGARAPHPRALMQAIGFSVAEETPEGGGAAAADQGDAAAVFELPGPGEGAGREVAYVEVYTFASQQPPPMPPRLTPSKLGRQCGPAIEVAEELQAVGIEVRGPGGIPTTRVEGRPTAIMLAPRRASRSAC